MLLVGHGLIHLIGVARAFRLAELPQLTQPIPPLMGWLWLAATLLLLAAAGSLYVWPRWWWLVATAGAVVSFAAILPSWADAKFGALANGFVLVAAVFGYLADGPSSLRAEYDRDVARGLDRLIASTPITDQDLAHLPAPVQRYLRTAGVVGQPRVWNMYVEMRGRIRDGPAGAWMPFTVEQHSFFDEPSRLFYMNASRMLVPIQGFHRYVGSSATMSVKAAGLVPVVRASGPGMIQAETVTMFNDMCLLAPATLVDPGIQWERVDGPVVTAAFTNAGHTIRAHLVFNDAGELINFWSDDRRQVSAGGEALTPVRWSTPIGRYRPFGPVRLGSGGEARWHEPAGEYAYIELEISDVQYNVRQ
jgi:hypothetical protein